MTNQTVKKKKITELDIVQGNRLILLSPFHNTEWGITRDKKMTASFYTDTCKFHKSWDMLLPVVESIEALGYTVYIFKNYCNIEKGIGEVICHNECKTKIKAVYSTVIDFIKIYNENKNK